ANAPSLESIGHVLVAQEVRWHHLRLGPSTQYPPHVSPHFRRSHPSILHRESSLCEAPSMSSWISKRIFDVDSRGDLSSCLVDEVDSVRHLPRLQGCIRYDYGPSRHDLPESA